MTRLKKMMAMVIAMVVAICTMSFGAFADNTTPTGNVTADPTIKVMGLETGDVAYFYQVLEWQDANANNAGGWTFVTPFIDMKDTKGNDITVDVLAGDPAATPPIPMGISSDIAGVIARTAAGATGTKVDASNGEASLTIDGQKNKPGLYLVLITPGDPDTVYNPVFVSSDFKQDNPSASWTIRTSASSYTPDSAATKRSKTTVEKKEDDNIQSPEVGAEMHYTVTATIPGYGEVYTDPHFVIKDQLNNMKLVAKSVKIVEPADAVATINETANGFTITFDKQYLKGIKTPTAVKVTYKAIVTTDAVQGINEEDNTIVVEYSHDPSNQNDYNVKKDTTEHYTFTIGADVLFNTGSAIGKSTSEIIKVGVDSAGKPISETKVTSQISSTNFQQGPLEGAHFKLYTDEGCTQEYIAKDTNGEEVGPLDIVSGADGRLTIPGLAAGDYWLKEVTAPTGYVKDTVAHHIEIIANLSDEDIEITEYYDPVDGKWYESNNQGETRKKVTYKTKVLESYIVKYDGVTAANHTFTNPGTSIAITWDENSQEIPASFTNTAGVELPATGGIGTTIFYAIGTILVLGAGILLVTRRRMETH